MPLLSETQHSIIDLQKVPREYTLTVFWGGGWGAPDPHPNQSPQLRGEGLLFFLPDVPYFFVDPDTSNYYPLNKISII